MDGFPWLEKGDLDGEQKTLWDELTLGPRGFFTGGAETQHLPGLYNAWLQFPQFGHLMLRLANEIRAASALPGNLRELLILTTSMLLGCRVEYEFHIPFARKEGLSDAVIAAIGEGTPPPFTDETERVIYEANIALVRTATLAKPLRDEVIRIIGFPGMMQLIAAIGLYSIVAQTSNVADVRLADNFSADPGKLSDFFTKSQPS